MELFGKNLDTEVVLIAEIGVNHEGDPDVAHKLLTLAAKAGADAVKFQSYTAERYATSDDPERLARVKSFALSEDDFLSLSKRASELGTSFFSTPVSEDWVPFLADISDVLKIASGDITFEPVIRAAVATGKKVIISTGTATIEEIDRAVGWVKDELQGRAIEEFLVLMHCVSAYPVPDEDANLLSIPFMAERYAPVSVGYSNHVMGPEAILGAVALGARVVEVHFTDNKIDREFRDHLLSADPNDLAYLAKTLPLMAAMRGAYGKAPVTAEIPLIEIIRKGVSAAKDLKAGDILNRDDLMFTRPATEIPSAEIDWVIGQQINTDCKMGQSIKRGWLDQKG